MSEVNQSLLRPGLCSVTLRHLSTPEVIRHTARAGLRCVEWGADVHAPPGDDLGSLATHTNAAGLGVASYGTYWRAESDEGDSSLLAAAQALGCRRLRIWAGSSGSARAAPRHRADVVARVRALADHADALGLHLAFEHHAGTLADTVEATLELLALVDRPNVDTYWQPRVGEPTDAALAGLSRLAPHVAAVHVFSWWPGITRRPLDARADLWTGAIEILAAQARPIDLLLEFVPDDDPTHLRREARCLQGWTDRAPTLATSA